MNPLSLIPTTWLWPAAAIVGVALLGAVGVQTLRADHTLRDLAETRAEWSAERARAAQVSQAAEAAARLEENRRLLAQKEANDEAQRLTNRARTAAAGAAAVAVGLHDAARAAGARSCASASDPAAVSVSASTTAAGLVLADVLGRADDTAGELAAALDLAHLAGKQCEREHDALTP